MSPKIATSATVGRHDLLEFVRSRHHVILVTAKRDGGTQLSPVTAGVDDAGRVVIATYPERAKTHNARRHPEVSLLVVSDEWDGPWIQVDGHAEVIDLPEAMEPLVEYFRAIAGEHDDWADYRAAMQRQGKALIRITIGGWSPIATGGLPPRLA